MNEEFMRLALEQARIARDLGEVPVGCVIVKDGGVIATGYNTRETANTPLGHAEIMAIESASKLLGCWRLAGCTLYVTLEPCPMCMGAIINSRIEKVIFGASDEQYGCCGSVMNLAECGLGHRPRLLKGILAQPCTDILSEFFLKIRNR